MSSFSYMTYTEVIRFVQGGLPRIVLKHCLKIFIRDVNRHRRDPKIPFLFRPRDTPKVNPLIRPLISFKNTEEISKTFTVSKP